MTINQPPPSGSVEQKLREEVAACTLILNSLDILGYSGHVSARMPDGKHLLIQSFDQSRASLRPDDLLICDLDGAVVAGPEGIRAPAEVYLHTEVLRGRQDVQAVAHFHDDLATTFTIVKNRPLLPVKNHAIRWADGIPVHPDPSHVSDATLGRALAETLGQKQALQIRAHGQVIVAESVKHLLIDSIHFVENARALYDAHMLGEVEPLSVRELEDFGRTFDRDRHVHKLWKYYAGRAIGSGVVAADWSYAAP